MSRQNSYNPKGSLLLRGTTAARPVNSGLVRPFFDTTLGKPIWLKNFTQYCLHNDFFTTDENQDGQADSWGFEQDAFGLGYSINGGQVISGNVVAAGGYIAVYQSMAAVPGEMYTARLRLTPAVMGGGTVSFKLKFWGESGLIGQTADVYINGTAEQTLEILNVITPAEANVVQATIIIVNCNQGAAVNLKLQECNLIKSEWVDATGALV